MATTSGGKAPKDTPKASADKPKTRNERHYEAVQESLRDLDRAIERYHRIPGLFRTSAS